VPVEEAEREDDATATAEKIKRVVRCGYYRGSNIDVEFKSIQQVAVKGDRQ
jgi:hypothetical protein